MKLYLLVVVAALAAPNTSLAGQESKPVPKDSVRVFLPGCTKGRIFTVGPRKEDSPGRFDIPEGMHMRMNGPKAIMAELKSHEGAMVEITGLMKKGQYGPEGVAIGGGVRISPGPTGAAGSFGPGSAVSQIMIDVEGWRPVDGRCVSR